MLCAHSHSWLDRSHATAVHVGAFLAIFGSYVGCRLCLSSIIMCRVYVRIIGTVPMQKTRPEKLIVIRRTGVCTAMFKITRCRDVWDLGDLDVRATRWVTSVGSMGYAGQVTWYTVYEDALCKWRRYVICHSNYNSEFCFPWLLVRAAPHSLEAQALQADVSMSSSRGGMRCTGSACKLCSMLLTALPWAMQMYALV